MSALKPYSARFYLMLAKRMRSNAIRNFAAYLWNLSLYRHVRIIYIKKAPAMLGLFKYFKQKIYSQAEPKSERNTNKSPAFTTPSPLKSEGQGLIENTQEPSSTVAIGS